MFVPEVFTLIALLLLKFGAGLLPAFIEVDKVITSGERLQKLQYQQDCPTIPLAAENIHIVSIATANSFRPKAHRSRSTSSISSSAASNFAANRQTLEFYAALHGYHYSVVNPAPIVQHYIPSLRKQRLSLRMITTMKSLVMLCKHILYACILSAPQP